MNRVARLFDRPWLVAIVVALIAGLQPAAARAESEGDHTGVMVWTTVIVVLTLGLSTVGYLFRRLRGMDHPTPDEVEAASHHDEGGHAAPAHH